MAVLRPGINEPHFTQSALADSSVLFLSEPVYARIAKHNTTSRLTLMIGAPLAVIVIGAAVWALMSQPAQTPTLAEAPPVQMAQAEPTPLPRTVPPAPMPQPAPVPGQPALAESAPARVTSPARRTTPAPRAAPESATDASSAASNASATVVAPAPAPVIAAPAAPAPTQAPEPAPPTPVEPM